MTPEPALYVRCCQCDQPAVSFWPMPTTAATASYPAGAALRPDLLPPTLAMQPVCAAHNPARVVRVAHG